MTTDKLTIGVDAVGAAKAAAEIDKVTGAVKKSVVATAESTKATQAQTLQIGQLGSSLGLAGQALGRVNPQIGQLTTMAGSATGVIQTLTTAGLGPLGIALGVVSIAITAGTQIWQEHKKAQEEAAEHIRTGLIPQIASLAQKYDEAAAAARRMEAITTGAGRSSEYRAAGDINRAAMDTTGSTIDNLRQQRRQAFIGVRGEAGAASAQRLADSLDQRIAEQESELNRIAGQIAAADREAEAAADREFELSATGPNATTAAGNNTRGSRRRRVGGTDSSMTTVSRAERAKASEYGFAASQRAYDEQQSAGAFGNADALKQKAAREAEAAQAAADAFMAAERSKTDFLAEQKRERDELTMAEAQKGIEVWGAYGESIGNVFGQALMSEQNLGKSLQNGFKAWAKGFAVQEIGKGLSATAEGIGAATNPVTAAMAPGYFASAGQHFAAAAIMGTLGIAIPSAGGGGGGGGGGSARIPREQGGGAGAREGGTVVINLSGPVIATADRAALGRELNALVGEGRSRYGES